MKMKALKICELACVLLAILALPAQADGIAKPNIPNVEDLIKHCWDISENKRASGVTALMREGGAIQFCA